LGNLQSDVDNILEIKGFGFLTHRFKLVFYNHDQPSDRTAKNPTTNIWLVGGARLAKDFIRLKLTDEIRVTVLPIILGDGLLFFDHIGQEQALHLKDVTAYKNGMVELRYEIKN